MLESRNITNYPAHILKSYSKNSQTYFAEQAIINKDYSSLRYLMKVINSERNEIKSLREGKQEILANSTNTTENNITLSIISELDKSYYHSAEETYFVAYLALQYAIEKLDPKAVEIILEHSKDIIFANSGLDNYLGNLLNIFDQKLLGIEDIEVRQDKIIRLILKAIPKEDVTISNLHALSERLSKQDFESFCQSKDINIDDEKYNSLNLNHYRIEDNGPISKSANKDIISLLLSRTYAEGLSLDEIKSIYQKIYDLHPIAKEMLTYTAYLISENDDLKIIFGKGVVSSYSSLVNKILINTDFLKETFFNIESVAIHEIGHYVYGKLFNFNNTPFNIEGLKKIIKELYSKFKEYDDDPYNQGLLPFEVFKNMDTIKIVDEFKKIKEMIEVYEIAARKPIDKAAELLHFNTSEYEKYNHTIQYTEYFKDHSYIDLFFVNQALGISVENKFNISNIPNNIFDNLLRVYLEEEVSCKPENPFAKDLSRNEISTWVMEQFFPQMVESLGFSAKQIHFLSRMGDYVNRGEHLLKEDQVISVSYQKTAKEKYVELIVRSMELRVANVEEASSFDSLDQFHISFASPLIRMVMEESYKQKMLFFQEIGNSLGLNFVGSDTTTDD